MKRTIEEAYVEGRKGGCQFWLHLVMPLELVREVWPEIRYSVGWSERQGPDGKVRVAKWLRGVTPLDLEARALSTPQPGEMLAVNAVLEGRRVVRVQRRDCFNLED